MLNNFNILQTTTSGIIGSNFNNVGDNLLQNSISANIGSPADSEFNNMLNNFNLSLENNNTNYSSITLDNYSADDSLRQTNLSENNGINNTANTAYTDGNNTENTTYEGNPSYQAPYQVSSLSDRQASTVSNHNNNYNNYSKGNIISKDPANNLSNSVQNNAGPAHSEEQSQSSSTLDFTSHSDSSRLAGSNDKPAHHKLNTGKNDNLSQKNDMYTAAFNNDNSLHSKIIEISKSYSSKTKVGHQFTGKNGNNAKNRINAKNGADININTVNNDNTDNSKISGNKINDSNNTDNGINTADNGNDNGKNSGNKISRTDANNLTATNNNNNTESADNSSSDKSLSAGSGKNTNSEHKKINNINDAVKNESGNINSNANENKNNSNNHSNINADVSNNTAASNTDDAHKNKINDGNIANTNSNSGSSSKSHLSNAELSALAANIYEKGKIESNKLNGTENKTNKIDLSNDKNSEINILNAGLSLSESSNNGGNAGGSGYNNFSNDLSAGLNNDIHNADNGNSTAGSITASTLSVMLRKNMQSAVITLKPASLGSIKINLAITDAGKDGTNGLNKLITVNILTQTNEAKTILQSSASNLTNGLKNQGFTSINLNISSGFNNSGRDNTNAENSKYSGKNYTSASNGGNTSTLAGDVINNGILPMLRANSIIDYFV